jgi:hypothetical protein
MSFQPTSTDRPCKNCEHFAGLMPGTDYAYCMRGDVLQVHTFARSGCVHWVRATGSDDEELRERK